MRLSDGISASWDCCMKNASIAQKSIIKFKMFICYFYGSAYYLSYSCNATLLYCSFILHFSFSFKNLGSNWCLHLSFIVCTVELYTFITFLTPSLEILFYVYAETEQGVAQAIIRSVLDFRRDPWPKVSENAKDLVRKMLDPDPKQRLTAQQVLGKIEF